jgi:hypothetical protein
MFPINRDMGREAHKDNYGFPRFFYGFSAFYGPITRIMGFMGNYGLGRGNP